MPGAGGRFSAVCVWPYLWQTAHVRALAGRARIARRGLKRGVACRRGHNRPAWCEVLRARRRRYRKPGLRHGIRTSPAATHCSGLCGGWRQIAPQAAYLLPYLAAGGLEGLPVGAAGITDASAGDVWESRRRDDKQAVGCAELAGGPGIVSHVRSMLYHPGHWRIARLTQYRRRLTNSSVVDTGGTARKSTLSVHQADIRFCRLAGSATAWLRPRSDDR